MSGNGISKQYHSYSENIFNFTPFPDSEIIIETHWDSSQIFARYHTCYLDKFIQSGSILP